MAAAAMGAIAGVARGRGGLDMASRTSSGSRLAIFLPISLNNTQKMNFKDMSNLLFNLFTKTWARTATVRTRASATFGSVRFDGMPSLANPRH